MLCDIIPDRHVGSPGNRAATEYVAQVLSDYGWFFERQTFSCIDWSQGPVKLSTDKMSLEAFASPYSLSCLETAPLKAAATLQELERMELRSSILLMHGELTRDQLMPKNFPFYNPSEHQRIIKVLEQKAPLAIITATEKNPGLAGAMYPFPVFEDGDFDIPSVYMTDRQGARLLKYAGENITLQIDSTRIPSTGENVIAIKGREETRRIVVCAHIDAKKDISGALDNATGIVTLLLLARLLRAYAGDPVIELIAFNGEDYYSAPGQIKYLEAYKKRLPAIQLVMNMDGVGFREGKTAFSFYECPENLTKDIGKMLTAHEGMIQGEPWMQSDHMIFAQQKVPAMAFTSEKFDEIWCNIAHTLHDTVDKVAPEKLLYLAERLYEIINYFQQNEWR
jgi:aminopeptidase YwaD